MGVQGNPFAEAVQDGSLLLSIPVAVLAGLVSFLSPCVLPLVPGFLGYVTGLTGADLAEQKRGRMVTGIGLFVLGFSVVFMLIGIVFTKATVWLARDGDWVTQALGLVVIVMGIVFMGGFSWFQRDRKIHHRPPAGLWGAPVLGMTFGLGWAPCIGPTLSAVLIMSTGPDANVARGALLTFTYCLGLGVPFLLIALGFRRAAGTLAFFKRHQVAVMRAGGLLLILLGLVMVTGLWGEWVVQLQTWFANEIRLPI
ncbi:MAG: cytochrome c biogenesis protein CcdA [Micrococcaceae bacterium]|nr:cytochrome c biogenesis protein CcdA [Micrococcaceae bacterium]MDN5813107.1 cytochrome c biogenesis protein CcdA [Micrococcaceae bacterium]MDN5824517.1 cytochrome c biogenesis protein CcdA [Micrococcaceae bacterium]MDN5878505.1 cytochrome c biogenesis protein CcdA [Micrococcaceae bacterium]MDN5885439.1 cytochrome c biogenesis protein CcdA [Micrococcaceae bacterium]